MFAPSRSHYGVHSSQQSLSLWTNELGDALSVWQTKHHDTDYDPIPTLLRLADLFEFAMSDLLKQDPDPLDDRHPHKTYPMCPLGHLLKLMFRYEDFMNTLVVSYLMARNNTPLNVAAARLLIDLVPGMDSAAVLSEPEDLIPQLYRWAQSDSTCRELRAYSFGLLAAALEVTNIAAKLKAENSSLMPVAFRRLKHLFDEMDAESTSRLQSQMTHFSENIENATSEARPTNQPSNSNAHQPEERSTFRELILQMEHSTRPQASHNAGPSENNNPQYQRTSVRRRRPAPSARGSDQADLSPSTTNGPSLRKRAKLEEQRERSSSAVSLSSLTDGRSNSQWSEQQRRRLGEHQIYPVTSVVEQRFIIQYLTPISEYQDLLKETYENRSLDLVLRYLDGSNNYDSRLIFDVLKYLAGLLVHRRLALDFVAAGGTEKLIRVERESLASTVVGTCIYYLAYNTDAMEGVCSLPDNIVDAIVKYSLWLLEHSYESGRAGASMFFAHAFSFRPILDRFDGNDGLRRLINYISTLTLLQDEAAEDLSDEQTYTSLQAVRNTCIAFRSYIAAHMYIKVDHLKRTHLSRLQNHPNLSIPSCLNANSTNKGMNLDIESLRQCVALLLHAMNPHSSWHPVEEMRRLGVIRTILNVVASALNWHGTLKVDIIKNCLDTLWMCSVNTRVQLDICGTKVKVKDHQVDAIRVILELCDGEHIIDPELQISALQVVTNCVSASLDLSGNRLALTSPTNENSGTLTSETRISKSSSSTPGKIRRQKKAHEEAVDILEKNWNSVRRNNGIMILKKLLYLDVPSTDADEIRANACKALNGLAGSESVRQILEVMPLIASSELCGLMREPILPDRRAEHAMFCEQAHSLIERVTKKRAHDLPKDISKEKLWKWYIVAHTKVVFNEKELLQLIHQHLVKKGLMRTAEELRNEADLPSVPASRVINRLTSLGPFPSRYNLNIAKDLWLRRSLRLDSCTSNNDLAENATQSISATSCTNSYPFITTSDSLSNNSYVVAQGSMLSTPSSSMSDTLSNNIVTNGELSQSDIGRNRIASANSSPTKPVSVPAKDEMLPHKNLDEIITEYFRKQHSMCNNPVSTCPPFSLYYPHHCPEPRRKRFAPVNLAYRTFNRPMISGVWNRRHLNADYQFVFSRFRPAKTFTETEETYTCCSFSVDDEHILLGTYAGGVHWLNIRTGVEESHTECHRSAVTEIEQSKDGSLLLTSSAIVTPLSSLWHIGETQEHMINFIDEYFVEFSKSNQDRIIGTQGEKATIYDTETGRAVVRLYDEALASHYTKNRATFDPTDTMVLNDGVLWDPRMGPKAVHKYDKLNLINSGVFHPHGIEVIINSEVWDMRNHKLVHSINALDHCKIIFSAGGHALYAVTYVDTEDSFDRPRQTFNPSFRSIDASTYNVIATVDAKRHLFDLAADHNDQFMAVIEAHSSFDEFMDLQENVCRLFEVGKRRDADDLDDEQEAVEDHDDDDDDDDDDITSSSDMTSLDETTSESSSEHSDESDESSVEHNESPSDENDDGGNISGVDHRSSDDDGNMSGSSDENRNRNVVVRIGNNQDAFDIVFEGLENIGNSRDIRIVQAMAMNSDDETVDLNYNPDEDGSADAHRGSSSIVLNPVLRRQRRNENEQD